MSFQAEAIVDTPVVLHKNSRVLELNLNLPSTGIPIVHQTVLVNGNKGFKGLMIWRSHLLVRWEQLSWDGPLSSGCCWHSCSAPQRPWGIGTWVGCPGQSGRLQEKEYLKGVTNPNCKHLQTPWNIIAQIYHTQSLPHIRVNHKNYSLGLIIKIEIFSHRYVSQ